MSDFINTSFNFLRIICLSLFFIACASITNHNKEYVSILGSMENNDGPERVVIMPFVNETKEQGIDILTRKSFYNHFSSKNYHDFELNEIDRGLEIIEKDASSSWRDIPPADIIKFFHSDYIIYGKVKEFGKLYLGIYSQIVLTVELEIIEGEKERTVWKKTITRRSHEGDLPFNPLSIIPAALRTGFHMKEDSTIELVDKVNRELASMIPEPDTPPVTGHFIEIQIASFLDGERAFKATDLFERKGFNARVETVSLGEKFWHRVVLGPYYSQPEAEDIRERIIADTKFKPVFIHHYLQTAGRIKDSED